MGCDIHIFAEVKKDNKWEKVGKIFNCPYFNENEEENGWNYKFTDSPYRGRNYNLFAILADVRNGRGFAGVKIGDGFNPISDPKGLPEDVSEEIKANSDEWGGDGHSHSYFSLLELKTYNWNQYTIHQGCVDIEEYKIFKERGHPDSWSGDFWGSSIRKISNEEMDKLILNPPSDELKYYTLVNWKSSYKESIGDIWFKNMEELSKLGNDDEVRIVFWFDN